MSWNNIKEKKRGKRQNRKFDPEIVIIGNTFTARDWNESITMLTTITSRGYRWLFEKLHFGVFSKFSLNFQKSKKNNYHYGKQNVMLPNKSLSLLKTFRNVTWIHIQTFFFLFGLFQAAPAAYGGSQAGGWIRAVAMGRHHSHSNSGSEPRLRPTPQLTATLDP